jgi:pimeloyl-ACP methyl ester carboxylesterase
METFVLIHGAWHGRWCWSKLIPLLEKAGHKVIAPDLPGHGENRKKDISKITQQDYIDCVVEVLDKQVEPVILLGHSMGGMVISLAAENRSDKIKKLVYLCSFLPKDGESMHRGVGKPPEPLSMTDEALKELFYGDCTDEDIQWAKSLLTTQPQAPVLTPIHITDENYGRVPRVYITCLRDKAIPKSLQKQMYTQTPCEQIIVMNTSHSPFLSAPEELARNLLSLTDN